MSEEWKNREEDMGVREAFFEMPLGVLGIKGLNRARFIPCINFIHHTKLDI